VKSIRILIVDGHAMVAEGLQYLLRPDERFEVVGSARNLKEACNFLKHATPDLILLDHWLPDSQGAHTVTSIRRGCPTAAIIVLTGHDSGEEDGFRQLGVEVVLRKESAFEAVPQAILGLFPTDAPDASQDQRLTHRESDVTRLVAQGMTNPEIAQLLGVSSETVKTHLANIARKLGINRRVDIARWWCQRLLAQSPVPK